jgi:hypothetical protein
MLPQFFKNIFTNEKSPKNIAFNNKITNLIPHITYLTYTGWRKKKLTCLICFNLKAKRVTTRELRALHSVLSNLDFDIRPVHFRAILTE